MVADFVFIGELALNYRILHFFLPKKTKQKSAYTCTYLALMHYSLM